MSLLGEFLESFYGSGSLPQTIWAQLANCRGGVPLVERSGEPQSPNRILT